MADLTTLDAVKDYLAIDAGDTGVDSFLSRLVSSESARFCSLAASNSIVAASYTDTEDGNGTRLYIPRVAWPKYPLQSVQSLTIDGVAVPPRPDQNGVGYCIVNGRVELVGYLFTANYSSQRFDGSTRGVANVVLTYTAGWTTVPADVDQAVVEMVALKFKARDRIGLMSQSVGGETLSYQTLTLPESIQSVIGTYSRMTL